MTVAMEEGHVVFQYNLGSGAITIRSENTYHDGNWHHIEVTRQQRSGVLKVSLESFVEIYEMFMKILLASACLK